MKQTAVEWLVEKLNQCEPMYSGIQSNEHKSYIDSFIGQAKKMEKEQIIQAYKTFIDTTLPNEVYEEHYNETFKSR